jgi:hypothetical protein
MGRSSNQGEDNEAQRRGLPHVPVPREVCELSALGFPAAGAHLRDALRNRMLIRDAAPVVVQAADHLWSAEFRP